MISTKVKEVLSLLRLTFIASKANLQKSTQNKPIFRLQPQKYNFTAKAV